MSGGRHRLVLIPLHLARRGQIVTIFLYVCLGAPLTTISCSLNSQLIIIIIYRLSIIIFLYRDLLDRNNINNNFIGSDLKNYRLNELSNYMSGYQVRSKFHSLKQELSTFIGDGQFFIDSVVNICVF